MNPQLLLGLAATLALAAPATVVASAAHDDASSPAYADGWDDGDNGGVGFGPWNLSFDGDANSLNPAYNSDPHFIDGVGVGPLGTNLLGSPAFGLTTDNSTGASVEASRSFLEPWKVGQRFSLEIDGSALEGAARIGNLFELVGADGIARYSLRTSLGSADDHWIVNGRDSEIPAGDAFRLSLTLTSPDTFTGSILPFAGGFGLFSLNAPFGGTAGEPIIGFRMRASGTGSSADGAREFFFNNLALTRANVPEPMSATLAALTCGVGFAVRRRK